MEIRILMLEDVPTDAELIARELRKAGIAFSSLRVEQREAFVHALDEFRPDLILADYKLPAFDGLSALRIARDKCPEIPFLFVTGTLGEETAIESLKEGATDYILKDRLSRLGAAVLRAMKDAADKARHQQMEEALQESEERFRLISTSAQEAIVIMDPDAKISYWNPAAARIFGYGADETLGQDLHTKLVPERYHLAFRDGFAHFSATGEGPVIGRIQEVYALRKGGEEFPVELSLSAVKIKGQWNALGIMRDITERKQAEQALRKVNRALKTLSSCNETLIHASNQAELLQDMCRVIVEVGGYRAVWVGFAQRDETLSVTPMAQYGFANDYPDQAGISWSANEKGCCPTGMAIRTGEIQMVGDAPSHPGLAPWRNTIEKHGLASVLALPLREGDLTFGALTIYSSETQAFDPEEIRLLNELASDLSFGMVTLRTRAERMEALGRLGRSMEGTIQAVAATVEMRDPYTAGHQRRVAELAAAIANELGLDQDRVHGIHLAGIIHDLGKINIPSEILSRPGRLSEIEYSLIRTHAASGYEILKDVEFPWPISQMVLQHHERLDGSGYPNGLRGEEILLEARILIVADVVEAMTSHRPYRPGLGLEAALKEISGNRGKLYDPAAVDACVKLFREKGFSFTPA